MGLYHRFIDKSDFLIQIHDCFQRLIYVCVCSITEINTKSWFLIECRTTKTIVITLANQNQSEFKATTCKRSRARKNACDQVTIGFDFLSHWFRNGREFCQPIKERSKAKQSKRELLSTLD